MEKITDKQLYDESTIGSVLFLCLFFSFYIYVQVTIVEVNI